MMKTLKAIVPMTLAGLMLAACSGSDELDMPVGVDDDDVIATVNGQPIPGALLDMFIEQRTGGQNMELSAEQRQELVDELVEMELLVQAAQEQGIHRESPMVAQLLGAYKSTLARAYLQDRLQNDQITEEDLRAEYESRQESGELEYNASHILLESEEKAREVIAQLEQGADFATLAKENSQDAADNEDGNLGWFTLDDMLPSIGDAVSEMEAGEFRSEPLQTQFGWHVLQLEDTRKLEMPEFDEMREELAQSMQLQRIEAVVSELREDARIRIKDSGDSDSDSDSD